MGMVRKFILLFTADLIFLRHLLGRKAHADVIIGVSGGNIIVQRRLEAGGGHQRHRLGTAGDHDIRHTGLDFTHRHGHGLHSAAAVAVNGNAGHFFS
ncbi:hypothetical protein FQZ97_956600 [compost metagenome]